MLRTAPGPEYYQHWYYYSIFVNISLASEHKSPLIFLKNHSHFTKIFLRKTSTYFIYISVCIIWPFWNFFLHFNICIRRLLGLPWYPSGSTTGFPPWLPTSSHQQGASLEWVCQQGPILEAVCHYVFLNTMRPCAYVSLARGSFAVDKSITMISLDLHTSITVLKENLEGGRG